VGIAHLTLDLGAGHQCGDRVDHQHIDGVAADQGIDDLKSIFTAVGLGNEQIVDIDTDLCGVSGVDGVFGVDDRGDGKNYMEMIAERFTPEQLGFTLDTYWVAFANYDVVSEIERLSGRLPRVHLKDMEILSGGTKRYCPVGSGVIDFEKALAAFEKAGTEIAFVEQDECFERDPFTCLKMSYDYLKSIGYN
jgi:hypothetical protein